MLAQNTRLRECAIVWVKNDPRVVITQLRVDARRLKMSIWNQIKSELCSYSAFNALSMHLKVLHEKIKTEMKRIITPTEGPFEENHL